ncbi:proteoglycan 4-like [Hibiscus syriacus]|uniref:proteoglycan 4-like n=1 Tax=Hibiscus syriacus TaxID=106335 RepID=UPI00192515CD|nr:proteoglycan 4-like [Hibiscus syriacus]
MGEQRQFFRFRLPWLSAAPALRPVATPRPAAEPQPAAQMQAPSRPTVSIPIQRPPFRPAGITPAQTKPSQVQKEPQPQPQPAAQTEAPSKRPPFRPAGITPVKPTPTQDQAPPQRTEPWPVPSRAPIPPRVASMSDGESAFKPFGVAAKPSEESTQSKEVAPITAAAKEMPTAAIKPKETEERKKVAEERSKSSTHEKPTVSTKLLSAATEDGTKTRELLGAAKEKGKRHPRKDDVERKTTDERQIKYLSSTYPKDRSRPSDSGEKHVDSKAEQVPLHEEIREDVSKFVRKLVTRKPKLVTTDENPVSVITLAGENSGASFRCDSSSDGEESSRVRQTMDSMIKENAAPKAYVNSNTQSINNSIMFESSLEGSNPGVHLHFFNDAKAEPPQARKSKRKFIKFTILTCFTHNKIIIFISVNRCITFRQDCF